MRRKKALRPLYGVVRGIFLNKNYEKRNKVGGIFLNKNYEKGNKVGGPI